MNTNRKTSEMKDRKVILSTLLIFASVNYIFCDVLSNMESGALKGLMAGNVEGLQINEN